MSEGKGTAFRRRGILGFVRKEPILTVAALAALVSCLFVPPDAAYLGYVDFRTLALRVALGEQPGVERKKLCLSILAHKKNHLPCLYNEAGGF